MKVDGLVECQDKQVGAVPLSVFIEQLQTRPEFPQVRALTCLILGRKVTKADPLPGMEEEPKKRRRKRKETPSAETGQETPTDAENEVAPTFTAPSPQNSTNSELNYSPQ